VIRLAISVGLLLVLIVFVAEPLELIRMVTTISPSAMLLAVILAATDRLIMAFKWRLLLLARDLPVSLWTAVRSYWASSLIGLVLPVTVGADAIRIFTLRQFGMLEVTASIVVERILGTIAMGSVALISCVLLTATVAGLSIQRLTVGLMFALVCSIVLFVGSLMMSAWWTEHHIASPSWFRKATESYSQYRQHPLALSVFYVLSIAESLLVALIAFVIAMGLGFTLPLYILIATIPIAFASARLPVSLGGFGVQEAAFVYLASFVDIPATEALAIMLLLDVAMLIALFPSAFDSSMLSFRKQATSKQMP
jgi:uncharacterized protein (TIRG00374 family)